MPTYPVINLETKEKKTLSMTMKVYDEWRKENPGWDKDWSEGCAGQSTEFKWTGEAKSMDGMRSWIVHLNNQVPMSAKTDTTVNPSNLL